MSNYIIFMFFIQIIQKFFTNTSYKFKYDKVNNLKYFIMENLSILVGSLGGGGAENSINILTNKKKYI